MTNLAELPFFSIIVPVYQSKKYLEKTVINLKKQTFKNFEIILVDDGSTDGSSEICDKLASEDKRIFSIHKSNGGASSARNLGMKNSRGKWIIFVDSDDIVSKVMCENFFHYINQNDNLDFITCNFAPDVNSLIKETSENHIILQLNNKNQNFNLIKQMLMSNYSTSSKKFRKYFGSNVVLNSPCAKTYRKEFILKNNLRFRLKVKYSEDLLFNIEVLGAAAKGIYVNDCIYFYNENFSSVTHKSYLKDLINNYFIFKNVVEGIISHTKNYDLQVVLDAYIFSAVLGIIPYDIFRPNYSFSQSYYRMRNVVTTKEFIQICNLEILKKSDKLINVAAKIKGNLLLKGHFFTLFLIYRGIKRVK